MDRGTVLLLDLRNKLQAGWQSTIQRSTRSTLEFLPLEGGTGGEFLVRASWSTPEGTRTYEKAFTRPFVFGASFHLSPLAWRSERRVCEHARSFIHAVLHQRGVL